MPAQGTIESAKFYQWLFYLNASLQPEMMVYFYPQKHSTDIQGHAAIKQAQQLCIADMFSLLDQELAEKPYLLGDKISACDFVLFMLLHWGSGLDRPPLSFQHLSRFLLNMAKRESVIQVCAVEETSLEIYA